RRNNIQDRSSGAVIPGQKAFKRVLLWTGRSAVARPDGQVKGFLLVGDHDRMVCAVVVGNRTDGDGIPLLQGATGKNCKGHDCHDWHGRSENRATTRRWRGD